MYNERIGLGEFLQNGFNSEDGGYLKKHKQLSILSAVIVVALQHRFLYSVSVWTKQSIKIQHLYMIHKQKT